jgi:hypothetical protein
VFKSAWCFSVALLVTLPAVGMAQPSLAAAAPGSPRCTIVGTPGDDVLRGTKKADVICGLGGNDTISGLGGNDTIDAGPGNDSVTAGPGSDRVVGGDGNDRVLGDTGRDSIAGQAGDDVMIGGPQLDIVDGGSGTNACDFTPGERETTTCLYDTEGPRITSLTATPQGGIPGSIIEIAITVEDEVGADRVGFYTTVNGAQQDICGQDTRLIAGSVSSGTWGYTCTVPSSVINGTYTVVPFARDVLGNWTNSNGGDPSDVRGTFTITGGSSDQTGPVFQGLTATPDTVRPGDVFTVSLIASDPSGIARAGMIFLIKGTFRQNDFCGQNLTLTAGTPEAGTWTANCTVPSDVIDGEYTIEPFAQDTLGNWTNSNGGTTDPTRGNFIIAGGNADKQGPSFTELVVTPSQAKIGQTVTITLKASDASGVTRAGVITYRKGTFKQNDFCGQELKLTSGTPQDGVWTMTCVIPAKTPYGEYEMEPFAQDSLGNWTNSNGGDRSDLRAYLSIRE